MKQVAPSHPDLLDGADAMRCSLETCLPCPSLHDHLPAVIGSLGVAFVLWSREALLYCLDSEWSEPET